MTGDDLITEIRITMEFRIRICVWNFRQDLSFRDLIIRMGRLNCRVFVVLRPDSGRSYRP